MLKTEPQTGRTAKRGINQQEPSQLEFKQLAQDNLVFDRLWGRVPEWCLADTVPATDGMLS